MPHLEARRVDTFGNSIIHIGYQVINRIVKCTDVKKSIPLLESHVIQCSPGRTTSRVTKTLYIIRENKRFVVKSAQKRRLSPGGMP